MPGSLLGFKRPKAKLPLCKQGAKRKGNVRTCLFFLPWVFALLQQHGHGGGRSGICSETLKPRVSGGDQLGDNYNVRRVSETLLPTNATAAIRVTT